MNKVRRVASAAWYLNKSYSIIESYDLAESKAHKLEALVKLAIKQNDFERAIALGHQALDLAQQGEGKEIMLKCLISLGIAYHHLYNLVKTESYIERALTFLEQFNYNTYWDEQLRLYKLIYQVNKKQNPEKALKYYETYQSLKDSMQNKRHIISIVKSDAELDFQQQKAVLELEQSIKNNRQRIFMTVAALLLVFAVIVGGIIYRNALRNKENAKQMSMLNDQITLEQKKLAYVNHKLSRFVHSVSHDIKSKLELVGAYSNAIIESKNEIETSKRNTFLLKTVGIVNELRDYCNDLLKWSERDYFLASQTDLNEVAQQLLDSYDFLLEKHSFDVKLELLPIVKMAEEPLRQILQNLIDNAIKFSKQQENPAIHIFAKEQSNHWEIFVKDNGMGMSESVQQQVFEWQEVNKGMLIIKDILVEHQETFQIDSKENVGTTFKFTVQK